MLAQLFATRIDADADATCLVIDGHAATWRELDERARTHAAHLLARGLTPGDRVALLAHPTVDSIATLIAHLRLGLVHVPLNTRYQPAELTHVLADSGAHDLRAAPFAAEPPAPLQDWPPPPPPDTPALIIYTSGTTGRPKGVVLSQRALADNLGAMMRAWQIGADDVIAHALPLFHVHGLGLGLLGPLSVGARVHLAARFSPAAIVETFAAHGATVFMGVPTMYHALTAHLDAHPSDARALAAARLFTAGSAALSPELLARFATHTGHTILERYGMTETLFTLANPLGGERRAGTVGLPVAGAEVRLVDDDGRALPADSPEAGELAVRGPGLMLGYWNDPEATRAAYRDGWFMTGDVVTRDPDGYHRIIGRRSTDIIKSGGFKIGAREIEDTLSGHPAVAEVAVVGLPDPRWGELVAAAVVPTLAAAATPHPTLADALDAHCRRELADYKRPRRFTFVHELPRNALGKVVKPRVRELFAL